MIFTSIDIIYNPNSTGNGADNAEQLSKDLTKLYPETKIALHKTKYAGHAKKIAYQLSSKSKKPLIISSSGDGGYNEVINGAIAAKQEGARPVCAVLASGNANDHSRYLQNTTLLDAIKSEKIHKIDVLKLDVRAGNNQDVRYAHSYIGLGITPVVAVELNKTSLNALKELWIVLRTFYRQRPFKIRHKGTTLKLDSIIFANIGEMAKVLTISKASKPDDGLFEVIPFHHGHKLRLLKKFVKATVSGLEGPTQTKKYSFTVLKKMPVQLDGEIQFIKKNSDATVSVAHKLLSTIY